MTWREFANLLACISGETPLGRVIAIRKEDDPEVLKKFTREQKQLRREWRNRDDDKQQDEQAMEADMISMLLA